MQEHEVMSISKKITDDENFMNLLPSKWWQNFFKKFDEIDEIKVSKWKEVHQLSYFCRRYESTYGRRYAFSLNGRPGNCTEIIFIKKIAAMLSTSNQKIIKEYIDWIFDYEIIPKNKKIQKLSFLMTPGLGNKFLAYRSDKNRIERSTELPADYISLIESMGLYAETYGDLAFIKQSIDQNPNDEAKIIQKKMLNKLYAFGLTDNILNNLK